MIPRRQFLQTLALAAATPVIGATVAKPDFRLRYLLSSAMYGEMPLDAILPEVAKTGCEAIDIWCRVHGNQREQITAMGDDAFAALLATHQVKLGVSTRYPLGPTGLQDEMQWLKKFGGGIIVTGSKGPSEPSGAAAKAGILAFLEQMKPHVARAEQAGVTIAIENHDRQLLHHPDSLRYFAEFNRSPHLGIAFAPHHLHAWTDQIPALIRDLGAKQISFMYFQEHSDGIRQKVAKEIEMKQLPGFGGGLDYRPLLKALIDIRYTGYVEIFMHPTPRGIPILPTVAAITGAINQSRAYVESCLREVGG
ncbi:sugar phosphate isomerase/epimerase family protein [Horticoccus sp. 23ND18S-11]|uniref:sugar phosphate isomerase/epimerase family protein n=1 Tax=Horticoccus sp. 23ND18S-11 TaxID=3391832 RepID=UPI0039C96BBF